jgi:diphosphomevalonate decarboxylase
VKRVPTLKPVTVEAGINIALVKYWGKRDPVENLPAVGSISLTLDTFTTTTTVTFKNELTTDIFVLNGIHQVDPRVSALMNHIRRVAEIESFARIDSTNIVPTASGLASSASGTAALAKAAWHAAGLPTDGLIKQPEFLSLVRRGSGSAPRSLLPGLVELDRDTGQIECLCGRDEWPLSMVVAQLAHGPKAISSRAGMAETRATSPYFRAWVQQHPADLSEARNAIARRDLPRLGETMERSTMRMHACMLANDPPLRYLKGITLQVMDRVEALRTDGIGAWYTMDAGPHVKVLCHEKDAAMVVNALSDLVPRDRLKIALPGPGATVKQS